jgi:hypothetical protein
LRLADEDIHDLSCSGGGFGDTEELPAFHGGDDQMLSVKGLRELEQLRLVDSRSENEGLKEQANADTVCRHE